jgi:hypothetical protein
MLAEVGILEGVELLGQQGLQLLLRGPELILDDTVDLLGGRENLLCFESSVCGVIETLQVFKLLGPVLLLKEDALLLS